MEGRRRSTRGCRDAETWDLLRSYASTRDLALRNELVLRFEGLVHRLVAGMHPGGGTTRDDLLQVGYLGLIDALERYDPSMGSQFVTFAAPTIVGVIKHYLRDHGWMIRAPRRLRELAMAVPRVRRRLEMRLGRSPSVAEVADAAGVPEEMLLAAMDANLVSGPVSLDLRLSNSGEEPYALADAIGAPDPALAAVEMREALRSAVRRLPDRYRELIECRYFRQFSQAQTARRLGISQMHVSRLERKALAMLRGTFTLAGREDHGGVPAPAAPGEEAMAGASR